MKLSKNFILGFINLFLLILFFVSFNSRFTNKDTSEIIKTELINEKNVNSITKIQFSQGNKKLFLIKNDDFWILKTDENSKNAMPGDTVKIEKFITDFASLRDIKKLSNKISEKNNYGFDDINSFKIRYFIDDDNFSDLIFGGQDFSLSSRYLMVSNKATVFELDDSLDSYLDLSIQQWSEPTIISKNVLGNVDETDIQSITITENGTNFIYTKNTTDDFFTKANKLLELRHGGLGESVSSVNSVKDIKIELGNKEWVTLSFYNSTEEKEYIIVSQYYIEAINKKYYYTSKISSWTYNRINEIML
ncbi:MAG: DUF4340 domain-containing protein [Spirochaetia bacterium]|nr:DUF4340 domain-containing protein [Spirochaetia bacterium]